MSPVVALVQNPPTFEPTEGEKLGDEITELCSYIYAATHHLLQLIREFDEQQYWAELGFSKVRAITRVADDSNEDYLLMVATHGTAHHVERLVAQYRRAQQLQDAEFANDLYRRREVTYYYDHDGCLVLKARIPAEQGELVIKALEMAMDEAYVADDEPEPAAARRADALGEVAETYMNNRENSGSTADRYQVVIHVGSQSATEPHLENGPPVTAVHVPLGQTSRRIACDCSQPPRSRRTTTANPCPSAAGREPFRHRCGAP